MLLGKREEALMGWRFLFQWAPTLGGECYWNYPSGECIGLVYAFQWAPTLGGECYNFDLPHPADVLAAFQWAPTLGGECYPQEPIELAININYLFQWAPTLGGECY